MKPRTRPVMCEGLPTLLRQSIMEQYETKGQAKIKDGVATLKRNGVEGYYYLSENIYFLEGYDKIK